MGDDSDRKPSLRYAALAGDSDRGLDSERSVGPRAGTPAAPPISESAAVPPRAGSRGNQSAGPADLEVARLWLRSTDARAAPGASDSPQPDARQPNLNGRAAGSRGAAAAAAGQPLLPAMTAPDAPAAAAATRIDVGRLHTAAIILKQRDFGPMMLKLGVKTPV